VIAGRWTYGAAHHWGDTNPWGVPVFIVTHRPQEQSDGGQFRFDGSPGEAIALGRGAAGDKDVNVMGGADTIRQALASGQVEDFTLIVAPITLGAGKRLFEGFDKRVDSSTCRSGSRRSPRSSTAG